MREVTACRVCQNPLVPILDLGTQCLAGQFPLIDEPDPPSFPLQLHWCKDGCGLLQLGHTVDPELLFRSYWYRSGISQTMRTHLEGFAQEAQAILGRKPQFVLDVGGNDGTLAACFPESQVVIVDPSDVESPASENCVRFKDFYPTPKLKGQKFDLIFTVACFYDADDPVAFASAVYDNLAPDGLWCLEVADARAMLKNLSYDAICHEHVAYYDPVSIAEALSRSGFAISMMLQNACNGGSLRIYVRKGTVTRPAFGRWSEETLETFAEKVRDHRGRLQESLLDWHKERAEVHLLGASTKTNVVLQYAGADVPLLRCAADRDPRKKGRRLPGTSIPIISEEKSRAGQPDVYLTFLSHFREELLARESDHLKRGGKIVFGLPKLEEVGVAP